MTTQTNLRIPREEITGFCRRHHVRKLSLFGSVLREDFRPDSDVDMLVEFEPGTTVGYRFITIQDELSELLGRRVDLGTPNSLSKYIRDRVLTEGEVVYSEG